MKEYQKQYRENMTDDQKQKMKEYQKKYRETKKLIKINKIFDLIIKVQINLMRL